MKVKRSKKRNRSILLSRTSSSIADSHALLTSGNAVMVSSSTSYGRSSPESPPSPPKSSPNSSDSIAEKRSSREYSSTPGKVTHCHLLHGIASTASAYEDAGRCQPELTHRICHLHLLYFKVTTPTYLRIS